MSGIDEGILREFLAESREGLAQVERDLVALEADPSNAPILGAVFRAFHSIKGTCGFFGFHRLATAAHAGESLLGRLRDRERAFDRDVADALLALIDAVRTILARIEATQAEGDDDFAALIERLGRLERQAPPPRAPARAAGAADAALHVPVETSVRVDVDVLDHLMNLVGELVLARNQLLLNVSSQDRAVLPGTVQRLDHVTSELQDRIMKTRMQPVGNLCHSLPRLVRDVASACGKQVRLEMEGTDTELDRTIIDAIRDPLAHLVRNAIDHGIERPADRVAKGKPPEGRLTVRAFHRGGRVHLEVADDGAGLPLAAIREHAVRHGLIPAGRLGRMTDRDWAQVIFLPGFTTADHVSNVSGRGVGMDVVKTNVERIGGSVDVESETERGTTMRIRMPLTLAIVPALIVSSRGERYAIPQTSLIELIRVGHEEAAARIGSAYDAPVLRYRGGLLPLLDLGTVLGMAGRSAGRGPREAEAISIAVLHADGLAIGLVVDSIEASQEIVVKPLAEPLRRVPVFAGATILGDGAVALILDVPGLGRQAGVTVASAPTQDGSGEAAAEPQQDDARTLVVCRAGVRWTVAIPQEQMARLEEFRRADVERIGDRSFLQYRGSVLPLLSLGGLLARSARAGGDDPGSIGEADPVRVVVWERAGQSVGIVVESIVEIVRERVSVRPDVDREGFLGTTVVHGAVTELVDLEGLLRASGLEGRVATAASLAPSAGERR